MTNAEKFENVFGFKPNSNLCYAPGNVECPPDCDDCPYISWLDDEYVAESKQGEQNDKRRTNETPNLQTV